MSAIELFQDSYLVLPKVFFLDERMELVDITNPTLPFPAVYDPDLGTGDAIYVSGLFPDYKGGTYHSDTQYNNHLSYLLAHEHGMFGYMPVLKNLNRWSHWHYIHIVSTTNIPPQDVMKIMPSGNIKFNASLAQFPPAITLYPDDFGNDHMLIEITPHLPDEDLSRVAHDIGAVKTYVQNMANTQQKYYEMKAQKEVQQAQLIGVQAQNIFTSQKYKQLLEEVRALYDLFNDLKLENSKKLKTSIMGKEMEHNLGLPYTFHNQVDIDMTLRRTKQEMLDLQAQAMLEGSNEAMENAVFNYVLSVMGIDKLKKRLYGTEQHTVQAASGLESVFMPKTPSLEELRFKKLETGVKAGLSEERLSAAAEAYLRKEKEAIKKGDINSAREELKREALRLEDYGQNIKER